MTHRIMTKNLFYALMVVGSFGVYTTASAMDKKSIVTRVKNNYLPTAKENLANAEDINQLNLTAIKGDIKKTEKEFLRVQPLNLNQVIFEPVSTVVPSKIEKARFKKPLILIEQNDLQKKEVARLTKQLRREKEDASRKEKEASFLEQFNSKIKAVDDFVLEVESPKSPKRPTVNRMRSKTLPTNGKPSRQQPQQPVQQQMTFDFSNDFNVATVELTPLVTTNNANSATDKHITRATGEYPIEAPKNLYNAELVNQLNLTPLRKDVNKIEQGKK